MFGCKFQRAKPGIGVPNDNDLQAILNVTHLGLAMGLLPSIQRSLLLRPQWLRCWLREEERFCPTFLILPQCLRLLLRQIPLVRPCLRIRDIRVIRHSHQRCHIIRRRNNRAMQQ